MNNKEKKLSDEQKLEEETSDQIAKNSDSKLSQTKYHERNRIEKWKMGRRNFP